MKRHIGYLAVLLLAFTACPGRADPCLAIDSAVQRVRQANPALSDATFIPYAASDPGEPMLRLPAASRTFYISEGHWKCYLGWEPEDLGFGLLMVDPETKARVSIAPLVGNRPIADVFARTGFPASGPNATRELFGKRPTLSTLLDVAFSTDASKYRCKAGEEDEGIRFGIALALADTALPLRKNVSAYRVGAGGSARLLLGTNSGGRHHMIADFSWRGTTYRLDAASRNRTIIDAMAYAFAHGKSRRASTVAWSTDCLQVWRLFTSPSRASATRLRAKALKAKDAPRVEALDKYLAQQP